MQIASMQLIIKNPKVCFISLNAYVLLPQKNLGFTGGAELQQVLLAKELSKRGFEVSFVTFDFCQKEIEEGYIYLRYTNVVGSKLMDNQHQGHNLTEYSHLFIGKSKIYNNGGSEVYKT